MLGIETSSGQPVIWCGFHNIDWGACQCETGFWVRKSAQGRGFAKEANNVLLQYAFNSLGMRRVINKLGFTPEGVQLAASLLPGGQITNKHCYSRLDTSGLPDLVVEWGLDK